MIELASKFLLEMTMHEKERHRVILSKVERQPVVTVAHLVKLLGASEATIRRDIAQLHLEKKLRRIRGGAEAIDPQSAVQLAGRPYSLNEPLNVTKKRMIAKAAAEMCHDGDSIIITAGTTTFKMTEFLKERSLQILTNSWPIANELFASSRNSITLPGGKLYREQNIILSPFRDDASRHFYSSIMFVGAQGLGPIGLMEADPQISQGVEKLLGQTERIVVLADSSKFKKRSSLVVCGLEKLDTVITDSGIDTASRTMLEDAGVRLVIPEVKDFESNH
jgi:DeoR family ulaG and ulaABCDEF operon transcriptional repressor